MNANQATPIIVGIAHVDQRIKDATSAAEPIDLMRNAVDHAAADAGVDVSAAGSVRVVRGIWPYQNPASAIARHIGADAAETALTPYGGNFVQSTVNRTALDIQSGRHDLVVITGAECGYTQARAAKDGVELDWADLPGTPDLVLGEDMEMRHDAEKAIRIGRPIQVYPLFETALRHHRGLSVEAHLKQVSELWAGFSRVAAENPNAWLRDAQTAEAIRTPSASNRPVSFPYPKLMNSNNNVDQGAAIIMCSEAYATKVGIPRDKWIYPWSGTDGHDHYFVSNRDNLYSSPAIRIAGKRCLSLAGVDVSDLDLVDVYSCFPSAVQVAAAELGLDTERPLTVTGGLTFAGGPLNNYVMHSIVRMVELLRAAPEQKGLITANGGYLTKHAFGVYSATPPARPFSHEDVQDEIDREPKRDVASDFSGRATIEAVSVMYQGDSPNKAFMALRTPDDRRAWATTEDADTMLAMTREEFIGREVDVAEHVAEF